MSRRGSRERRGSNSGISREINKRLRHTVLNQHKLTNRFTGNDAAKRVERACTPQLHASMALTRTPSLSRHLLKPYSVVLTFSGLALRQTSLS